MSLTLARHSIAFRELVTDDDWWAVRDLLVRTHATTPVADQVEQISHLVQDSLGDRLVATYLYGSAVAGGLKAASDIDLLAVTAQRTTPDQRRRLIDGLRPLSARDARPAAWHPVELTICALPDVIPWRYPPGVEFQSGEWLRGAFDAGRRRPWRTPSPDMAVLIAQVRRTSIPLIGPRAGDVLPDVPRADLTRAMTDEITSLLADLETDTANVLLTLARIWHTVSTDDFATKDAAADWATVQLGEPLEALEIARDAYLGRAPGSWLEQGAWRARAPEARAAARVLVGRIERACSAAYNRPR